MMESTTISMTFVREFLRKRGKKEALDYLNKNDFHVHFPEGSTKKDGPSAGIAITSTLLSLALGK